MGTKRNYSQLFAICKKHGFDYKDKVAEFTNGRTDSLKSLTDGEYREMMLRLSRLNEPARKEFVPKPGDQMRKKMLSICSKMHPTENTEQLLKRLNDWCLKQTYKKPLMKHDVGELSLLVTLYEQKVYADFLTGYNR